MARCSHISGAQMTERNILEILEAVAGGTLSVDALLATYGGRAWHIPAKRPETLAERNSAIYEAWDGNNMREIRIRFDLSRSQVYGVLRVELMRRKKSA